MPLIALDLDGTLEDSRADMVASVHRVRARLGLSARPDAAVRPWVNRGMPTLYARCFDDWSGMPAGDSASAARLTRDYEADYFAHIAVETRPYPGIPAALSALAGLGTLVVITNKPERLSRHLLATLGLDHHFAEVMGGDSCAEPKPSPLSLRIAAARCGISPGRDAVLMIGDSPGDIRLGHSFGAITVWCGYGYSQHPGPIAPHHQVTRPSALVACVRGALAGAPLR